MDPKVDRAALYAAQSVMDPKSIIIEILPVDAYAIEIRNDRSLKHFEIIYVL